MPPFTVVLAVLPATPLVMSQARKVRLTVPLQLVLGTKRIIFVGPSRRAAPTLGARKASQVAPASVEYCQAPFVLSTAVTAMASTAALSNGTSVIEPLTMMAATVFPPGAAVSSAIAVSV